MLSIGGHCVIRVYFYIIDDDAFSIGVGGQSETTRYAAHQAEFGYFSRSLSALNLVIFFILLPH